MAETIYDKLGDLLNETLEAGEVKFVKIDMPQNDSEENNNSKKESPDHHSFKTEDDIIKEKEKLYEQQKKRAEEKGYTIHKAKTVVKKITPEVERALRLLDLTVSATSDDLKAAYKEKLKIFHPDKYENNAVMQKVATDKTRQVVEAYSLLQKFFGYN